MSCPEQDLTMKCLQLLTVERRKLSRLHLLQGVACRILKRMQLRVEPAVVLGIDDNVEEPRYEDDNGQGHPALCFSHVYLRRSPFGGHICLVPGVARSLTHSWGRRINQGL